MNKKKVAGICAALCLTALAGCGGKASKEQETQQMEGSYIDKNGNIVDKDGNTFNKKGEWQVPVGGHVDANGYIRDKNGKIMGGGARVGSVG
ncbi:DUF3659 domain-containing protein [Ruminococcus sp. 5_1_39BFAA]|uniref:DUF3659 domain-containing protein n=1 Tax=Ruminococcus sp. 5_1_39BFAA TaxID=457412 RepID=UPI0035665CA5